MPSEMWQGFLTLLQARSILESKPARTEQLKGDLQMHTLWSDGGNSVEEMAKAGAKRGYEYIAITDHAKGLKIAGGIDEEQLLTQAEEISQVNDAMASIVQPIRILRSIELNLSPLEVVI